MDKFVGLKESKPMLQSFYDNANFRHVNFVLDKEKHFKDMIGINTFHESTIEKYRKLVDH